MSAGSVVIGCFRDPAVGALVAGDVIVVVDVVRATTTAVTAVAQGRRCFTAPSVAAARRRAARLEQPLLAGEIGGVFQLHHGEVIAVPSRVALPA